MKEASPKNRKTLIVPSASLKNVCSGSGTIVSLQRRASMLESKYTPNFLKSKVASWLVFFLGSHSGKRIASIGGAA